MCITGGIGWFRPTGASAQYIEGNENMIDVSKLGYRWKGAYSPAATYAAGDVVLLNGSPKTFNGSTFVPFGSGQTDAVTAGHLMTGGYSVGGVPGSVLHAKSGGIEFRFPDERNGTHVVALAKTNKGFTRYGSYYGMAAVMSNGTLRAWGYCGTNGALGEGSTADISRTFPALVPFPKGTFITKAFKQAVNHIFAVDSDGKLWGAGIWSGNGTSVAQRTPVDISSTSDIKDDKIVDLFTSSDYYNACYNFFALGESGRVYAWGDNTSGVLGLGHTTAVTSPTLIPMTVDTPIKEVVVANANYPWAGMIAQDGRLFTTGYGARNWNGSTTINQWKQALFDGVPVVQFGGMESHYHASATGATYGYCSWVVLEDGRVYLIANAFDNVSTGFTGTAGQPWLAHTNAKKALFAHGGYFRGIVLTKDNTVEHIGYSGNGISPTGANSAVWTPYALENIEDIGGIAANYVTTFYALDSSGRAYVFGTSDGAMNGCGLATGVFNSPNAPIPVLIDQPIVDIQISGAQNDGNYNGAVHALTTSGDVYSWGAGIYGQVGDDDDESITVPTTIRF